MSFRKSLMCIAMSVGASMAHAAIVYDGGSPDQVTAYPADRDTVAVEVAQKISLASDITFSKMIWWGAYAPSLSGGVHDPVGLGPDNFLLNIRSVAADGKPGAVLSPISPAGITRTATPNQVAPLGFLVTEYSYEADFSAITLAAGDYFIGISNEYLGKDWWAWETTSNGGQQLDSYTYFSDDGQWNWDYGGPTGGGAGDSSVAFRLENDAGNATVPEPASLALTALGLAGLGFSRRRKA